MPALHKWLAATVAVLFAAIAWIPTAHLYANVDVFVFGTAARRLLAGQRLYADFSEAKPPLMTLAYAIPGLLLPGQEKSETGMTVLLVVALLIQLAMWLYFLKPEALAGLGFALFLVIYPATYPDFAWASSEHFSNAFISPVLILSRLAYRDRAPNDRHMFLMGAATCLAFHFRQNCLLVGIIPLAVAFTCRQPLRAKLGQFAWFVAGGLSAWAAILVTVCFISSLPDYFYQVFIFPRKFAVNQGDFWSRKDSLLLQLKTAADVQLICLFALALGLALCRRARVFVIFATLIGIGYCAVSPRPHGHYLVNFFPFITLLLFVGLEGKAPGIRIKEWLCLAGVVAALCLNCWNSLWKFQPSLKPMDEVVQAVNRVAGKGDTLYVGGQFGCEYIALHADPLPGNKYSFGWEIDYNAGIMAESSQAIMDQFVKSPPSILVFDRAMVMQTGRLLPKDDRVSAGFDTLAKQIYPTVQNASGNSLKFVQLAELLLTRHAYKEAWNNTNFFIFKLENNPTNQLPADAIPANVPQVR